jgi:hypothetical protein
MPALCVVSPVYLAKVRDALASSEALQNVPLALVDVDLFPPSLDSNVAQSDGKGTMFRISCREVDRFVSL